MENFQPLDDLATGPLNLDATSVSYIKETAKWAKFLSILGFIGVGFMVIAAIGMATFMSGFMSEMPNAMPGMGVLMGVMYLAFAALYFFPTLYLYRYATNSKIAIEKNDQTLLTDSFGNMKSVFKFWGILMAVVLVFYGVILVFAIVGGGIGAMLG